jgi:EF-hand domain pair
VDTNPEMKGNLVIKQKAIRCDQYKDSSIVPFYSQVLQLVLHYIKYIMMTRLTNSVFFLSCFYTITDVTAFTPSIPKAIISRTRMVKLSAVSIDDPYFTTIIENETKQRQPDLVVVPSSSPTKKRPTEQRHGESGIFTPAVLLTKKVLGEEQLNKIRAKAIAGHSNVIGSFVETAETAFGNEVLKQLFYIADQDRSGTIETNELKKALQSLGFDWLQEKQIQGILERADKNQNGKIDLDEWIAEAPKTLRTNLIKLAKKNGGELGFLS